MSLNNKHRALSFLITLAFVLPIVIKTHHMMFPNHEHHCHSCVSHTADLKDICEIQEFDYFHFTPANTTSIPTVSIFQFETPKVESIQKSYKESIPSYGLRAPPFS
ncbi:hypothetical protein L3049_09250 [Labilibaculum sp. DW002]|uniref:DUF2607 family protein n=1 Tax=Paralabilibaculum antarcticum TaxID=2912572 RepID=A0ABT5VRY7_9BACT|nr:hypothetical protein [Labilibaculum sp. DW002]MDE5418195.1 hypothetical protein [Labilibaculum sp. DW002]